MVFLSTFLSPAKETTLNISWAENKNALSTSLYVSIGIYNTLLLSLVIFELTALLNSHLAALVPRGVVDRDIFKLTAMLVNQELCGGFIMGRERIGQSITCHDAHFDLLYICLSKMLC